MSIVKNIFGKNLFVTFNKVLLLFTASTLVWSICKEQTKSTSAKFAEIEIILNERSEFHFKGFAKKNAVVSTEFPSSQTPDLNKIVAVEKVWLTFPHNGQTDTIVLDYSFNKADRKFKLKLPKVTDSNGEKIASLQSYYGEINLFAEFKDTIAFPEARILYKPNPFGPEKNLLNEAETQQSEKKYWSKTKHIHLDSDRCGELYIVLDSLKKNDVYRISLNGETGPYQTFEELNHGPYQTETIDSLFQKSKILYRLKSVDTGYVNLWLKHGDQSPIPSPKNDGKLRYNVCIEAQELTNHTNNLVYYLNQYGKDPDQNLSYLSDAMAICLNGMSGNQVDIKVNGLSFQEFQEFLNYTYTRHLNQGTLYGVEGEPYIDKIKSRWKIQLKETEQ